jgi:hypothetical protein
MNTYPSTNDFDVSASISYGYTDQSQYQTSSQYGVYNETEDDTIQYDDSNISESDDDSEDHYAESNSTQNDDSNSSDDNNSDDIESEEHDRILAEAMYSGIMFGSSVPCPHSLDLARVLLARRGRASKQEWRNLRVWFRHKY